MKKEMISMAVTTILFVGCTAVALFVWHSWYLYYGVLLAGYIALMLLTVILKRNSNIEFHYSEQFIRDKTSFYSVVTVSFGITFLLNVFLVAWLQSSTEYCLLMIFLDFVITVVTLIITMYWCERSDWRTWLINGLFG